MKIGAIEAGGTKMVCVVSDENLNIVKKETFKTETPDITMMNIIEFFKDEDLDSFGIGSFGPIDINESSDTFGYITDTPKEGWSNFDFVGKIKSQLGLEKVYFDTDVNCAALGELHFGSAKGLTDIVYITVGTGIGGGAIVNGNTISGLLHPEMGHIYVRRHKDDDFEGNCPFHKDCLEGMASGPAIEKRWNKPGIELKDNKEVWELEAYYIAQGVINYILTLSPQKVIIGGGVMQQEQMFQLVRKEVVNGLNSYINKKEIVDFIDEYIVYPKLGQDAGIIGTITMVLKGENSLK